MVVFFNKIKLKTLFLVLITIIGVIAFIIYLAPYPTKEPKEPKTSKETSLIKVQTIHFRESNFDVLALDLTKVKLQLFWRDKENKAFQTFKELSKSLDEKGIKLLAATNAGIFAPEHIPVGLHIERGQVLHELNLENGEGNFYLKPNGVFFITSNGAKIVDSAKILTTTGIEEATQSGPALLLNGIIHPVFQEGSQNHVVRSGVGVSSPELVYLVISQSPVNFYDFSLFFKERLDCQNALYLDGVISKLYLPSENRLDDGDFTGILAVLAK